MKPFIKLATIFLVAAIVFQPRKAQSIPVACGAACIWGGMVLLVGGGIIYGLVKICRKTLPPAQPGECPTPPQAPPAQTNHPPQIPQVPIIPIFPPVAYAPSGDTGWDDNCGMMQRDISSLGHTDPDGYPYRTCFGTDICVSDDGTSWHNYAMTGWVSWDSGALSAYSQPRNLLAVIYTNGVPARTNYCVATNGFEFLSGNPSMRFFKIKAR